MHSVNETSRRNGRRFILTVSVTTRPKMCACMLQSSGGHSMSAAQQTMEQRLRLVEDKLAIYHLIASHPPAADTGDETYYRDAFTHDGTVDLGGGKTADGNEGIASDRKSTRLNSSHIPLSSMR